MAKTEAPYTISKNRTDDIKLRDKSHCPIGVIYTRPDAELIHAILNKHDGLVAALRTIQCQCEREEAGDIQFDTIDWIRQKAQAALADIEGE